MEDRFSGALRSNPSPGSGQAAAPDGAEGILRPLVVHPLPAAPAFYGRLTELKKLREFWATGHGVVSLIGIGGAGKTALAERFHETALGEEPPDGLLVWSFYDDPDANHFLKTAYEYFTGGKQAHASGAGWFSLLSEVLSSGKRFLLILDGLERVQRQETDASGIYGELEDPLLRGLLLRIASGAGNTKAIITSRFPVSSIERFFGRGYSSIDVNQLVGPAAHNLIRAHGVTGDDDQLNALVSAAGGHALTIDLLAGAVARFFDHDPSVLPKLEHPATSEVHQAGRLTAVLDVYASHMDPVELELLKCLCVFRFGVNRKTLTGIFVGDDKESISGRLAAADDEQITSAIEVLVNSHLAYVDQSERFTIHPTIRDHFYRLFRDPTTVHEAVREHYTSLTKRPGIGLPEDKDSLDLLEELIHHALQAGSVAEAEDIFFARLGGSEHLGTTLGDYLRSYRILSSFPECPDRTGMYHCLRAFGDFEHALEQRPHNRYILLLQGKLETLTQDKSISTSSLAKALRGIDTRLPDRTPDVPVPSALVHLLRGDATEAARVAELEGNSAVFADDQVRNRLILSEAKRQLGETAVAKEHLESCSDWVLNSASQEHLCLYNWLRGRSQWADGNRDSALQSLGEALNSARECWFLLLEATILADRARFMAEAGDPDAARTDAQEALDISQREGIGYFFGIQAAQQVLDGLE